MPLSRAERDRLLLPTKATPSSGDSKRQDLGWNDLLRVGS
jgi:hypothetical protein